LYFLDEATGTNVLQGHQVAYSPTYCSMVVLGDEGKPKWIKLQYPKGDIGESMQDRK
jgi:mediator of RNA polymerase II transcription subunit 16